MSELLTEVPAQSAKPAIFFDGVSSRRRQVTLTLGDALEIAEDGEAPVRWAYADIRRADSPAGVLRLASTSAPPLARLEVRDAALAADLTARCLRLDERQTTRRGVARIVGWSVAAAVSIVCVVLFGVPLAADRLAPLVPKPIERRIGDASEVQVKTIFGRSACEDPAGKAAFTKLVNRLRDAAGLDDDSMTAGVLPSSVPNAFALPGGKVFVLKGLLDKAESPDELAGILAHELGHLKHHDNMRGLIYNGGTSFLIGLLFGDVTGSSAVIFASRSVVEASYSREAETGADTFAIDVMHALGRSPKPAAELMFRITGKEGGSGLMTILASHPLTEDRLARMTKEDRPASGPPLLTDKEWRALKAICGSGKV
ncbi:M48 family metallopeptidase [Bradyrhizobium sp. 180]|uniref:M48 family metallopeptidase n=1 Tax=unclassified Bradyrhizobium TaxID=2631580 RepID=UPI001FF72E0C|nr:M48 family metallopeptidase [Bradyrhizobium sp. CW12]MCK1489226.1 M48 family metallopeptidase [Bradyrhizobium sp. 180]MCK1526511.1 M48 family metallopeptidase [Bradyrhizobium sp. 182]MCK1599440.1 M48 family metallopeptidase [Bradyrhizobium sp. 164]MCK1647454.1 M48 family metallopeptidase [Bradyrhizobium sp. 154]MCK1667321.1 M48 family metallopeptidase [Bradyrhizobium sp. 153]MCK1755724.1 M48 family metallopeptidase [Bradyrhizobium sp. 137]